MKDGSLKEMVNVDARLTIAAFCLLVILQLFPTYFLFGMRSVPYYDGSVYLIWVGVGSALVSGFISKRAGRLALLECVVATALYCLVIFLIYGGHGRGYALRGGVGSGNVLIFLVFLLCILGSIAGRVMGLREENKVSTLTPE
ncbi:MAG: hypothetical protein NTZ35_09120 [Ignavibacteriales bacterium]|nr:hypothetical protein [Ignavibacteriales bacterium]